MANVIGISIPKVATEAEHCEKVRKDIKRVRIFREQIYR